MARNYLFARQILWCFGFFACSFHGFFLLFLVFVLVISTNLILSQSGKKCKIFIQFVCCFIYNRLSIISLLNKIFIIVVLFTTIICLSCEKWVLLLLQLVILDCLCVNKCIVSCSFFGRVLCAISRAFLY